MNKNATSLDIISILVCTLAWGTTWYAITLQFGVVDPVVSIVYRFTLAATLLFLWCLVRGQPLRLSPSQHSAALGIGLFTFAVDYVFVYWAEERITSAVVATIFAALAFVNMVVFRLVFGYRASGTAWLAAMLGVAGVALLSWSELVQAELSREALVGLLMAFGGVMGAAIGNVFARRGEVAGTPVATMTAWSMAYGVVLLTLYAAATQRSWAFDTSPAYILSLLHLALIGSVVAFLLYYGLARRRGYATASYISTLTPPLAMLMSTLFEGRRWGPTALGGVALVILGQWLLLRARKA